MKKYKLGILSTHPIQYFSPLYRALTAHPEIDLQVYYAHRQTPEGQAAAGFGVPFEWDLPLLEGYRHQFLKNEARHPGTDNFFGCNTPEIREIILRGRFDAFVVNGWFQLCYWQAMRACKTSATPVLVRGDSQLGPARSWTKRFIKAPFYHWFIPRFEGYLIVGKRAKEYLRHYGASEEKMFSVPHAVDNRYFAESSAKFRPERSLYRREWGLPPEGVVFLFAGKLVPRKRPMDFLKAIHQAAAGSSRLWGLVAGDGPMRAQMERYVTANHLPIRFTGFLNQSAVPKAYAVSDALVLPSDSLETWGLVVNEAMASGLPVIVSDEVGCAPDLVEPDRTGDLFRGGDWKRLGQILRARASALEELQRMGSLAKKKIAEYSIEKAVEGIVEATRQISYHQATS